jgi:hypothetical protein
LIEAPQSKSPTRQSRYGEGALRGLRLQAGSIRYSACIKKGHDKNHVPFSIFRFTVVVKITFCYSDVILLQPLMPSSLFSEHICGKRYKLADEFLEYNCSITSHGLRAKP